MFRVLDGGPPPLAAVPAAPPSEDDHFVLTPAALAYLAQSQSRGRDSGTPATSAPGA